MKRIKVEFKGTLLDNINTGVVSKIKSYLVKTGLKDIQVPDSFPKEGKWSESKTLTIPNILTGPVAHIFETLTVKYAFAFNDKSNVIYLNLEYKYIHTNGGSNGYSVSLKFDKTGAFTGYGPGYNVA